MRIFNAEGEKQYQEWVLRFCAEETKGQGEVPYYLLESSATSVELYGTSTPERDHWHGPCPNKYEMITYLKPFIDECLPHVSQSMSDQRRIWDSFALHFFDHICPKDKNGGYAPNKFERYMINDKTVSQRATEYRQHIFGPYRFVVCNQQAIRPFFKEEKSSALGEIDEQIGSRQEFVSNPQLLELVNILYVENGKPKPAFSSAAVPIDRNRPNLGKKSKPGNMRRLVMVIKQLNLNYDFLQCSKDQMLGMLGNEFIEWWV